MNTVGSSIGLWAGFAVFILVMLSLDLGLFNRKAHTIRYREALIWSGVWISLAMVFAALVFWFQGTQRGLEFITGYLIELSLSVDNLFVFLTREFFLQVFGAKMLTPELLRCCEIGRAWRVLPIVCVIFVAAEVEVFCAQ